MCLQNPTGIWLARFDWPTKLPFLVLHHPHDTYCKFNHINVYLFLLFANVNLHPKILHDWCLIFSFFWEVANQQCFSFFFASHLQSSTRQMLRMHYDCIFFILLGFNGIMICIFLFSYATISMVPSSSHHDSPPPL